MSLAATIYTSRIRTDTRLLRSSFFSYTSVSSMVLALETSLLLLLALSKQSRYGATRHPLSNLTRTLGSAIGNYQQSKSFKDNRVLPSHSFQTLTVYLSDHGRLITRRPFGPG